MRDPTYRDRTKPWYGTAQWKRRRAEQLGREPLCWMCLKEGVITPATVADHDPPHKGDYHVFLAGPLRSLCKRHHDSDKALMEAGKAKRAIGADGWPIK
jgi:5-methylcytosine-specific restriction protein A